VSATGETTPCHTSGVEQASVRRPWAGDPRADAKDALLAYALEHPEGVPVICAARAVLDPDAEAGDADHRLALRFYDENNPNRFKTDRRDGYHLWVEPDPHLLLNSSRHTSADLSQVPGSLPSRAPSGRAAQVARSVLRDRCEITPGRQGAGVRAALTHALAAHREGVDTEGMRPDRVSDPSRVAARQGEYLGAFEAAARRHRRGALLTLTARPGESGDMVDTAVAVSESVGPLRDHLRRQTPEPGRPPAIVAHEVTGRGVLHLHVLVFGVGPGDLDRDDLARYWHETRGHGYVVDLAPVERRPDRTPGGPWFRWVFGDHADAETRRGRYVRAYLGETLFRFREVAAASPAEIHAHAAREAEDGREWWKVALLWSCGLPLVSVSESLRERRTETQGSEVNRAGRYPRVAGFAGVQESDRSASAAGERSPLSRHGRYTGVEADGDGSNRGYSSLSLSASAHSRNASAVASASSRRNSGRSSACLNPGSSASSILGCSRARRVSVAGLRGPVRGLDPPVPPPRTRRFRE